MVQLRSLCSRPYYWLTMPHSVRQNFYLDTQSGSKDAVYTVLLTHAYIAKLGSAFFFFLHSSIEGLSFVSWVLLCVACNVGWRDSSDIKCDIAWFLWIIILLDQYLWSRIDPYSSEVLKYVYSAVFPAACAAVQGIHPFFLFCFCLLCSSMVKENDTFWLVPRTAKVGLIFQWIQ